MIQLFNIVYKSWGELSGSGIHSYFLDSAAVAAVALENKNEHQWVRAFTFPEGKEITKADVTLS